MLTPVLALQQLYKAAVAVPGSPLEEVKAVVIGDPIKIESTDFPMLIIMPSQTAYNMRGSRYDEKKASIELRLVFNQKQYYDSVKKLSGTVSNAVSSAGETTYSVANHKTSVGDAVKVTGVLPIEYNGTFKVSEVVDQNNFKVVKSVDGSYISGGTVYNFTNDRVMLVMDAMEKVESTLDDDPMSVANNTLCGVIQKNTTLPYTNPDGETFPVAVLSKVVTVDYTFNSDRGYPTFEVIVDIEVLTIGDR
jgi:hypothetical protein